MEEDASGLSFCIRYGTQGVPTAQQGTRGTEMDADGFDGVGIAVDSMRPYYTHYTPLHDVTGFYSDDTSFTSIVTTGNNVHLAPQLHRKHLPTPLCTKPVFIGKIKKKRNLKI